MSIHNIYKTNSRQLSKLFTLPATDVWLPAELGDIWRHQLDATLDFDLRSGDKKSRTKFDTAYSVTPNPPKTFGELLHNGQPPLQLLKAVKAFGKEQRIKAERREAGTLPIEIATLLYFASAAVALTKYHEWIVGLSEAELRKGLQWSVRQPWVDEATRAVVQEAIPKLRNQKRLQETPKEKFAG